MASTGFRNEFSRQAPMGAGPGRNCPIAYTVSPLREDYLACKAAYEVAKTCKDVPAVYLRTAEQWLHAWRDEHNRLLNYSTLARGIKDPTYAPKFQAFHRDSSQLKFVRGPNQFGKTFLCAAEVWFYFQAKHPWLELPALWADARIKKTIVIVTGSENNRDGVYNALWETCPIDAVDWVNTHYDKRNKWGQKEPKIISKETNVEIIFRASNQEVKSLASFTVDLMWIDEPPNRETIDELRRSTVAKDAPCIMSFTPIGEAGEDFTWLRDYVEGDSDYRRTKGAEGKEPIGDWSQHHITIDDCPWFSADAIAKRRRAYRKEQIPQRLYGEWDGPTIGGRFGNFDETKHVFDELSALNRVQFVAGVGSDHGQNEKTQTAVCVEFDPVAMILYATAEYESPTKTASSDDAEHIGDMLATVSLTPKQIRYWIGDINSSGKEQYGLPQNILLQNALEERYGSLLNPVVGPNKYQYSVETEEKRIDEGFKLGHIRIYGKCHKLLSSLRHYKGKNDKEDKELKHMLDAFRYIVQKMFDTYGIVMLYSSKYSARSGRVREL